MKGIILTAGASKRLRPITDGFGKVLVPIYDKPMIFYDISFLFACEVYDIVIVCSRGDLPIYKKLLQGRFARPVKISFVVQENPKGTADALNCCKDSIKGDFVLLFGDNIFLGNSTAKKVIKAKKNDKKITVFLKEVKDPERFGVAVMQGKNIVNIEEKPQKPQSNTAITGLYLFKGGIDLQNMQKSVRGEYELTDIFKANIDNIAGEVIKDKWLDTGTFDSLYNASMLIKNYQTKNGVIGFPELELYKNKIITKEQLLDVLKNYKEDFVNKVLKSI